MNGPDQENFGFTTTKFYSELAFYSIMALPNCRGSALRRYRMCVAAHFIRKRAPAP